MDFFLSLFVLLLHMCGINTSHLAKKPQICLDLDGIEEKIRVDSFKDESGQ